MVATRRAAAAAADGDDADDQQRRGSGSGDDDTDDDDDDGAGVHVLEAPYGVEGDDDDDEDEDDDDDDDDDDEDGWAEETDDDAERRNADAAATHDALRRRLLGFLVGRGAGGDGQRSAAAALRDLPRLPVPPTPIVGEDFAALVNASTRAWDVGQAAAAWPVLDRGFDASAAAARGPLTTEQQAEAFRRLVAAALRDRKRRRRTSSGGGGGLMVRDADDYAEEAAAEAIASGEGGARDLVTMLMQQTGTLTRAAARRAALAIIGSPPPPPPANAGGGGGASGGDDQQQQGGEGAATNSSGAARCGFEVLSTAQLVFKRELAMGKQQGFSAAQRRHLASCGRAVPLHPQQTRGDGALASRAYICRFTDQGDLCVVAYQDKRVRVFDVNRGWALRKDVQTRMTRWTITDTATSPDGRLLVYSSIAPVAFVVSTGGADGGPVESISNVTELHDPLPFDGSSARGNVDDDDAELSWGRSAFGIWSVAWAPTGGHLIAGTNDNSVYMLDVERKRAVLRLTAHDDDVNAVAFLSAHDPHVIVSGSDDAMVRLFDVRDRAAAGSGATMRRPSGVLVGHLEGVTHIDARGDGRYVISNSKDQTVKLWDVRAALSPSAAAAAARLRPPVPRFDYRWESWPLEGYAVAHGGDASLQTLRGHSVLQTLIRAYFSPAATTGQRYIYAGSADGTIVVWDAVGGDVVARLEHHRALVRDCSWHPHEPGLLASASFDGRVVTWGVEPRAEGLPLRHRGDVGRY